MHIYAHISICIYIDIYIYRHISSHSRVMMGMLDVFYSRDQSAPRLCTHQNSVMIIHTPNYSTQAVHRLWTALRLYTGYGEPDLDLLCFLAWNHSGLLQGR